MAAPTCTSEDHADVELEWHCESPSSPCEWWTCPDCSAVYDIERGVKVTKRGDVEAL